MAVLSYEFETKKHECIVEFRIDTPQHIAHQLINADEAKVFVDFMNHMLYRMGQS